MSNHADLISRLRSRNEDGSLVEITEEEQHAAADALELLLQIEDNVTEQHNIALAEIERLTKPVEVEPFGYVREIRPGEWKFAKTTSWSVDVWPPVYSAETVARLQLGRDSHGRQAAHFSRENSALNTKCVNLEQVRDTLQEQVNTLRGVLRKIASCESKWPGDAVSLAREALAATEPKELKT